MKLLGGVHLFKGEHLNVCGMCVCNRSPDAGFGGLTVAKTKNRSMPREVSTYIVVSLKLGKRIEVRIETFLHKLTLRHLRTSCAPPGCRSRGIAYVDTIAYPRPIGNPIGGDGAGGKLGAVGSTGCDRDRHPKHPRPGRAHPSPRHATRASDPSVTSSRKSLER